MDKMFIEKKYLQLFDALRPRRFIAPTKKVQKKQKAKNNKDIPVQCPAKHPRNNKNTSRSNQS